MCPRRQLLLLSPLRTWYEGTKIPSIPIPNYHLLKGLLGRCSSSQYVSSDYLNSRDDWDATLNECDDFNARRAFKL